MKNKSMRFGSHTTIANHMTRTALFVILFVSILAIPCGVAQAQEEGEEQKTQTADDQSTQSDKTANQAADGKSETEENIELTKADLGLSGFNWMLYQFFTGIGGIVLWFGGFMLDYTMKLLVVDMAGSITRFGMGAAIDSLWTVVRDIFNLLFIFGLIYIGFMTILRSDDSGTKRLLGAIIGAALLINFSLYVTKVVIDFSNVAAYQIYQLIQIDGSYESYLVGEVKGVAGKFMEMTDLASYTKSASGELKEMASSDWGIFKVLGFSIIVMIFMLVSGFVFLSGAILLLSRFITLIMLMIFSPAMFLGWVFPGFASHSKRWWDLLLRNAFVAPAYIFMIYLSLRTLEAMEFGSSSFSQAYSTEAGESGFFGFFLYYLIIIGFVYASLLVARQMGAVGANQAMSATQFMIRKAQGVAGATTFGLAAAMGRATLGRGAQAVADSERLKEAASKGGFRGWAARRALGASRYVGDASFDARKVGGVGKQLGIGEGTKGGYKTKRESIVKKEQAFAKSLGEVGDDDPTVIKLKEDVRATEKQIKEKKDLKSRTNDPIAQANIQLDIDELEDKLKDQNELVKREKSRRQIGSGVAAKPINDAIKTGKQDLNVLKKQYKEAVDNGDHASQRSIEARMADKSKEIAKLEKQLRKEAGGYASVVQYPGLTRTIGNWMRGRNKDQNRAAGEAIRKEYEKKIKKSKEDERFDTLGEKLDKASKEDK